ncbi:uncharacterized protein LOC118349203 [Juglans regia]|uniref:Uncharacterized protein LOC118349203 n=1 Tax=Juglans regia TaxID=51240 RepID=A0A6P9EMM0_JUGRE|nr:uncharacterized protein LOC118349203 [Juglans regia]
MAPVVSEVMTVQSSGVGLGTRHEVQDNGLENNMKLRMVDVAQEDLLAIVVNQSEVLQGGDFVAQGTDSVLIEEECAMAASVASFSDTEILVDNALTSKEVCSDSDTQERGKKRGEAIGMKVRSSKRPKVVVLAEPFLRDEVLDDVKRMLGFDCGFSNGDWDGKLWIFWMNDVDVNVMSCGSQHVTVIVSTGLMKCKASFVYAKCTYVQRRELWADLEKESNGIEPWIITGDFNIIASDVERRGGRSRSLLAMEEFNSWIHSCGLQELKFLGKSFSWCNGQAGRSRSWARLDRSLVTPNFVQAFPDSFMRCVREVWDQPVVGTGLIKLAVKLKKLKTVLKGWNKTVFGWTSGHIKQLEDRIERLEESLQLNYDEEVESDLLASKMELQTWNNREEMRLAQCAKVRWWRHGDQNLRYFHALLNKRRQSKITEMRLPNGLMLKSPQEIHDGVVHYFREFLGQSSRVVLPELSDYVSIVISDDDNLRLCSVPTEEEVKQAVFSIPIESSPRPDGFGSGFYRACWDIVSLEVVEAVQEFFRGIPLPRFYTASFVVLIPKMDQSTRFDKFRPISLCSVFYKICTKVLVARLAPLLSSLISSEQCAFIPGRSIFDNISITQEMVQSLNKKAMGGNIILKLDKAKAYDRVEWDFLLHVLIAFGFSSSVSGLIRNCIASPWYSIMMNVIFANGGKRSLKELMKVIETYESWSGQQGRYEDLNHVFLEGDIAAGIWKRFSTILGVPYDPNKRCCGNVDVRQGWKTNVFRWKCFGGLFVSG